MTSTVSEPQGALESFPHLEMGLTKRLRIDAGLNGGPL